MKRAHLREPVRIMPDDTHNITALLKEWQAGKQGSANQLMEILYGELHELAAREMRRERVGHTLQTTALVHETYLRLCGGQPIDFRNRAHFFAVAAQQVRRILVDHARRAQSGKRGGASFKVSLADSDCPVIDRDERLLAIDEVLARLEVLDERAAKVIELRYFGGLSEKEAAAALSISVATMKRDWDFARTWLASQLM